MERGHDRVHALHQTLDATVRRLAGATLAQPLGAGDPSADCHLCHRLHYRIASRPLTPIAPNYLSLKPVWAPCRSDARTATGWLVHCAVRLPLLATEEVLRRSRPQRRPVRHDNGDPA